MSIDTCGITKVLDAKIDLDLVNTHLAYITLDKFQESGVDICGTHLHYNV